MSEPLDPELRALLDAAEPKDRPADPRLVAAVRERVALSLAAGGVAPKPAAGAGTAPPSTRGRRRALEWLLAALGGAAIAVGVTRMLPSRAEAPREVPTSPSVAPPLPSPPAPLPIVTASVAPPPLPAPSAPPTVSAPRAPSAPSRDDALAREGNVVDVARAALAHRDYGRALEKAEEHARTFPQGRLTEEREAIAIQALAGLGRMDEARARADGFRRAFPRSVFVPVVNGALQ